MKPRVSAAIMTIAVGLSLIDSVQAETALATLEAKRSSLALETVTCALANRTAYLKSITRSQKADQKTIDEANKCRADLLVEVHSIADSLKEEFKTDSEKLSSIRRWYIDYSKHVDLLYKTKEPVDEASQMSSTVTDLVRDLKF